MKRSTMEKLCDASEHIRIAAKYGFDFPTTEVGLNVGHDMLSQECLAIGDIKWRVNALIERLSFQDIGKLVDWLFKPGSIDPDSLIPDMQEHYAMEAEMWLDENRGSIAARLKEEAQEMYDILQREDVPQEQVLKNDLICKLQDLEELGTPVYLEDGVYLYVPEDTLKDEDE